MAEIIQSLVVHAIGEWCWHVRLASPCRVMDRQDMWGETAYRVWLPTKGAVVRARSQDLTRLDSIQPTVSHILHTAAAAKLLDALEDNLLLAPIQSSVVPLPHQLYALNRAMSQHRIRYLLADEVGTGQDYRGRFDPARTETSRHGQARAGGGTQRTCTSVAG